jgi:hypothetical protein
LRISHAALRVHLTRSQLLARASNDRALIGDPEKRPAGLEDDPADAQSKRTQLAYQIDLLLVDPLSNLPVSVTGTNPGAFKSLAARNLVGDGACGPIERDAVERRSERVSSARAGENDRASVWRPLECLVVTGEVREPARLATTSRNHEHVVVPHAAAREGDPLAVGGELPLHIACDVGR